MDTANPILKTRETMIRIFRGFPITMLTTILLLGAFQGNVNLLVLAVGLGALAPLSSFGLNIGIDFILTLLGKLLGDDLKTLLYSFFTVPNASTCTLFDIYPGSEGPAMVVPSYWVVMTTFFFAYLIYNASDLYSRPTSEKADPIAVRARKTRAMMSIIFLGIANVILLLIRYAVMSCETTFGLVIGAGLGTGVAYIWYKFIRNCGLGHFDDIFGISSRLLSKEASGIQPPKVCIPKAADPKGNTSS